jgi:F-type H+-transporting ATPase subunit epsilon
MAALTLEIVTPERRIATMQADEVRAPGILGGFGIRRDHTPFMSQLGPGRLAVVAEGAERHFAIGGGFLQVADNKVIVLADSAEEREEIDVDRAERAFRESTERLRSITEGDENYPVESARVRRAAARLEVAGRR